MPPSSVLPRAFQSYKPWHMQVAGAICINTRGEVLLVRGRLGGKWSFPKGHKKRGESDLQCALRELWEETGIIPESDEPMRSYKLAKATYYFFSIEKECTPRINDSNEIDMVEWWPLGALPTCNSNVDVSMFRSLLKTHPLGFEEASSRSRIYYNDDNDAIQS